jgi:hypothetical protein
MLPDARHCDHHLIPPEFEAVDLVGVLELYSFPNYRVRVAVV